MEKSFEEGIKSLPHKPGVYFFKDKDKKVIYVGKALNLFERVKTYFSKPQDPKTKALADNIADFDYLLVPSEFEGLLLEASLIKKYQPKYNTRLKDDKSFTYVAFTQEEFPRILIVRKVDIAKPKYIFGPFPSARIVRQVMKSLRRIFPYCTQKGENRPCFWSHLGLCKPCPGEIVKTSGQTREEKKGVYLNNIKNLASILSGKSNRLIKEMTRQMEMASGKQDYERASLYRDKLNKLSLLSRPHFLLTSYFEDENLQKEGQDALLEDLKKCLSAFIKEMPFPKRIESYDISNISGYYATGSLAVFLHGWSAKNEYRKFKIKITGKPDDTAMIAEILDRRLLHKEWEYPQLIIIDGGKSQVSAARKVINQIGLKIPIIGLAKKEEEIIIPQGKVKFISLRLSHHSPVLHLLMQIRDEAHRFALTYHRKLRLTEFDRE